MGEQASSSSAYMEIVREVEQLIALGADPRAWIEENLWLRSKQRAVVPFRLNSAQLDYYLRRTYCDIILKARQLGFTTLTCGLFFADTLLNPNTISVIVAHDADSSQRIFQIVHLFQQRLPEEEKREIGKPRILNRREIYWPRSTPASSWVQPEASPSVGGRPLPISSAPNSRTGRGPRRHSLP